MSEVNSLRLVLSTSDVLNHGIIILFVLPFLLVIFRLPLRATCARTIRI